LSEPECEGFGFERLEVWRKATLFAREVYRATRAFPKAGLFGLTMQPRRAAVSVAANIAEGSSRSSGKEQARFFEIAYGSVNEVATMLYIAYQQEFLANEELKAMRSQALEICRMLSGLRRSVVSVKGHPPSV